MQDDTRFWDRVRKTEGCWLWIGSMSDDQYGLYSPTPRRPVRAHRFAYEAMVAPIPRGMLIDHICRHRACVNPAHLRTVDRVENAENHGGATTRSKSGIRGVCWSVSDQCWIGRVSHRGKTVFRKRFNNARDAEAAVLEARLATLTHNDLDRITTMRPAR